MLSAALFLLVAFQESPTQDDMSGWTRALGAEGYAQREAAMKKLLEAGEPAIPFLYDALETKDREVRARIVTLLRRIQKSPIDAYLKRVAALVEGWDDSEESEEQYRRLFDEAEEMVRLCDSASKKSFGTPVFRGLVRKPLRHSKSIRKITDARILRKDFKGVRVTRSVVLVSGDLEGFALQDSVAIVTGSVKVTFVSNSVIIAGGEIEVSNQAEKSVLVTPSSVKGNILRENVIASSGEISGEIVLSCVLVNCAPGVDEDHFSSTRVKSKGLREWMEFKLYPPAKKPPED